MLNIRFRDRRHAGQLLAERLTRYTSRDDVLVLALPRGGVPVAFEISEHLHVPLDVFLVRKLGVPWQPELAMGAIAANGVEVLNDGVVADCHIPADTIRDVVMRERAELDRRLLEYRGERPLPQIENRTVILVDDGLATGSTMRAAVTAVRHHRPRAIVVAVPVAEAGVFAELKEMVEEIECHHTPNDFSAVGQWYDDFGQTTDAEVRELLDSAHTKNKQF